MATAIAREKQHLQALSILVLCPENGAGAAAHIAGLSPAQRDDLLQLADSHHVVVRALRPLAELTADAGLQPWIANALAAEEQRIQNALQCLVRICAELEAAGCPVTVIKSLDHHPDLGNDLDLYTTADEPEICEVFVNRLGAAIEPRSWGDRLAHKWNFTLPALQESVEVHSQRLGQTGEHIALARRLVTRRTPQQLRGHTFLVPAPEERVLVATLQRMYRHFYLRVCDVANTAALVEAGALDWAELKRAADLGGIWPGVATYLKLVSDYVKLYRGAALPLPREVLAAAQFGGERLYVMRRFLRIPLLPDGSLLYARQLARTALRGDLAASFRLTLLPPLAATAAVAFKITGDDKGIW